MKEMTFGKLLLIFVVGIIFGFADSFSGNKSGKLSIILLRGFLSTLVLSGGYITALIRKGKTIKKSVLQSREVAIPFYIAYFIGAMLFKLYY